MRRSRGKNYLREGSHVGSNKNSSSFERGLERADTIRSLHVGKMVNGEVFKVMESGALVNFGGVVGFVHVSEVSELYVKDIIEHLHIGRKYDFKVIEVGLNKMGELSTKLTMKFDR